MAIKIINDNTKILCINTLDNSKVICLDLYSFNYVQDSDTSFFLSDATEQGVKVRLSDALDDEDNTFSKLDDLKNYLDLLSRSTSNLGTNVRLDNIELSNTGSHLKMVNLNTGENSFMVQQRVDPVLGTTSVYYTEHTTQIQVEDSTDAYQPYSINNGNGVLNNSNRYALPIDIQVIQNTFVHEYRSILNTDIENLNIKIFNVTQSPDNLDDYRELTGTGIVVGWYISKRPYWTLNKQSTIDTKAGQLILSGNASLPFDEGFSLTNGEYYRFVISGDNDFEFQGVDGVPNPFGGTQFIPYIERSFTGEIEVNVKTEGAKIHTTALDFYRDGTNTTIILSDGESYPVNTIKAVEDNGTIKIISVDTNETITHYKQINHDLVTIAGADSGTTITTVVNSLNSLFAVQPLDLGGDYISTLPTLTGVDITANFAEGQDPLGDSIYGVGTSTGQHDGRVWSDETINETGEFYEVKITGKGQFMLGLYSVADGDLAEIQNNTGNGHTGYKWANAFYNYGSYIAPWTTYGSNSTLSYGPGWQTTGKLMRTNTVVQDNLANANPANPVLFKVGINAQGYIAVYYFDEGRSNEYIMTARSSYTLPEGEYGLMVKLVNGTVQLVETPTRTATDPAAPILTYRYIESPDGVFNYPIFSTEEEANYFDSVNGGTGSGTSHTHTFADDPTNTTWYMPDNGGTMVATSAPVNTIDVTYNEISSLTDADLVPTQFTANNITQEEGTSVNIQVTPAGATWSSSVNITPSGSGLVYDGYSLIQGTLTDVGEDTVYTVTVTRANAYGSSVGTMTVTATDVAPTTTNLTPWTKALDFSGSNEHLKQVTQSTGSNAIRMGGSATTVGYWEDTKTVPHSAGRPWSTAVVFKPDGNTNTTQTIWNSGSGGNTGVDNIFVLYNGSTGDLIFEWGRNNLTGSFNRCTIATGLSSNDWHGVYVTHKGTRFNSGATATNLENIFDIRVMSSADNFNAVGVNKAVAANWTHTGAQMDRYVGGDFTVAGRGTNRPFYGKVASMVITTLMLDTLIPTDAEIKAMITDPTKWLQDYKVGNSFRASASNNVSSSFAIGSGSAYLATQVWLMGDGTSDSYANGVRNYVLQTDQNYTKLQPNSMVSNDFENVNINGLT